MVVFVSDALLLAPMISAQTLPPVQLDFVKIPPGQFWMGCLPGDLTAVPGEIIGGVTGKCPADELPRHLVRISRSFEMGKYEVTQAQWESMMGTNSSHF